MLKALTGKYWMLGTLIIFAAILLIFTPSVSAQQALVSVTVTVTNSDNQPIPGVTIIYNPGGSWYTLGTTDGNGGLIKELAPKSYGFQARHNATSSPVVTKNIGVDAAVSFQTVEVIGEVKDSQGNLLDGAQVIYNPGGSWYTLGYTVAGLASKELFPGTYGFKASYNATWSPQVSQGVSGTSLPVEFKTDKITAKLTNCAQGGLRGAQVIYNPGGSWYTLGYTDPNGVASKELFPGTYGFKANYNATWSAPITPFVDETTPAILPTTTKVTLYHSGAIIYNPGGSWYTFTKPSMELFPGSYPFKFGNYQTTLSVSGCAMSKAVNVLRIKDSTDSLLPGARARGGFGANFGTWYVAGTSGADGLLFDIRDVTSQPTTMSYEMGFNNTTAVKTQDVSVNSVFDFKTVLLTLRVQSCGGAPQQNANIRYGSGSTYTTWWFPGGVTNASGETKAQVFPGTYSFEAQYQATAEAKINVVVPNANSAITWNTTKVTLAYSGQISYGGATGDSTWFTKPSMELLPGTYKFNFRNSGDGRTDLTLSGCAYTGKAIVVRFKDSAGNPLAGGTTWHRQYDRDYAPVVIPASGYVVKLITDQSTLATNLPVRMEYQGTYDILTQNTDTNSVYEFQTKQAEVVVKNSLGTPLPNIPVGYWGADRFLSMGNTDANCLARKQVLAYPTNRPATNRFTNQYRADYNATYAVATCDISTGPCQISSTKVTSTFKDSNGALVPGATASYWAADRWLTIGTTDANGVASIELMPYGVNWPATNPFMFKARMDYVGTYDTQTPSASGTLAYEFQTKKAEVIVKDSLGNPLANIPVGYWGADRYLPMGSTNTSGLVSKEVLAYPLNRPATNPYTNKYRADYNATYAAVTCTTTSGVCEITATKVTVKLLDNAGSPVVGATASYWAADRWITIGMTDANGEASIDLMPYGVNWPETNPLKFKVKVVKGAFTHETPSAVDLSTTYVVTMP